MAFNGTEKFYVCAAPQINDLTAAAFEALPWVQVKRVGDTGEWQTTYEISHYTLLDSPVVQKQKVFCDWGVPVVDLAYDVTDVGQITLRALADTAHYYAFKRELSDGTIQYGHGDVKGPERPDFGDDFILERYRLRFVQEVITKT
jgi:hypothetical protein